MPITAEVNDILSITPNLYKDQLPAGTKIKYSIGGLPYVDATDGNGITFVFDFPTGTTVTGKLFYNDDSPVTGNNNSFTETIEEYYDASWMSETQPPMARWISQPYKVTNSSEEPIGVFAKAIAGIEKVEIYKQYGTESAMTGDWDLYDTITEESTKIIEGFPVTSYWTTYDASAEPQGTEVRFYAKIYANDRLKTNTDPARILELKNGAFDDGITSGDPRSAYYGELMTTLQGGSQISFGNSTSPVGAGSPMNGSYIHVIRCGTQTGSTIYIDYDNGNDLTGDGSYNNPFKTITGGIYTHSDDTGEPVNSITVRLKQGDHYFLDDDLSGFSITSGVGTLVIEKDPGATGEARIVGCKKTTDFTTYTNTYAVRRFGFGSRGCVEFRNIVFYNSDLYNMPTTLADTRSMSSNAKAFLYSTYSVYSYINCTFDEGWDDLYDVKTGPSFSLSKLRPRGTYLINCNIPRSGNPTGSSIAINTTAGEVYEDLVNSQMEYKTVVETLSNEVVSGFARDAAATWTWGTSGDSASTSLTGDFVDYSKGGTSDLLAFEMNIDGSAVLTIRENENTQSNYRYFGVNADRDLNLFLTGEAVTGATSLSWSANSIRAEKFLELRDDVVAGNPITFRTYGSPHPDVIQNYHQVGDKIVRNLCFYDINATGASNETQGLYLSGGAGVIHKNCYFGKVNIFNASPGVNLNNFYVLARLENCLFDDCEFNGSYVGNVPNTQFDPGENRMIDTVIRNCDFLDYPPGVSTDRISSAPFISDYRWYGADNYPEVPGYPKIGFMAGGDSSRDFANIFVRRGTFAINGYQSYPWYSDPFYGTGITTGSGFRYEGKYRGLAPAAAAFTSIPSILPTIKNGATLDVSYVAEGYPEPTVTFAWQKSTDQVNFIGITGATGSQFAPTTGVSGEYYRVEVTATNSEGSTSAFSNVSTFVQNNWNVDHSGAYLVDQLSFGGGTYETLISSDSVDGEIPDPNRFTLLGGAAGRTIYDESVAGNVYYAIWRPSEGATGAWVRIHYSWDSDSTDQRWTNTSYTTGTGVNLQNGDVVVQYRNDPGPPTYGWEGFTA